MAAIDDSRAVTVPKGRTMRVGMPRASGIHRDGALQARSSREISCATIGVMPCRLASSRACGAALALTAAACTIDDIDLRGRSCPCAEGWTCDVTTNRCVEQTVGFSDAGAIDVVSFTAEWATPNAIRWRWELSGRSEDFFAFQLALGTSHEEVAARSGLVTGADNPELDRFELPRTSGVDPVVSTITYDLEPDTDYFAQLIVIDTASAESTSPNVANEHTADSPVASIDIMLDAAPLPGRTQPSCMMLSSESSAGPQAYAYSHHCAADGTASMVCQPVAPSAPLCWENVFLEDMQIAVAPESFPLGAFDEAYLEVAVRVDDSQHAWWSTAGLRPIGGTELRSINGITYRANGAYRVHQFKLTELGITYDEIVQAGGLQTFYIGSAWSDGATVRFDEVRIRW